MRLLTPAQKKIELEPIMSTCKKSGETQACSCSDINNNGRLGQLLLEEMPACW